MYLSACRISADVGAAVLANCRANAERHLLAQAGSGACEAKEALPEAAAAAAAAAPAAPLLVRRLDWLSPPDFLLLQSPGKNASSSRGQQALSQQPQDSYDWRPEDIVALQRLDYLLAADCFYDNVLTEACMRRYERWACGVR